MRTLVGSCQGQSGDLASERSKIRSLFNAAFYLIRRSPTGAITRPHDRFAASFPRR